MTAARRLWEMDQARPKTILVVGDAMEDVWLVGTESECQDGCRKHTSDQRVLTPGGAANAARALTNWCSEAMLISPWRGLSLAETESRHCFDEPGVFVPVKTRLLHEGKVVYRIDHEARAYGLADDRIAEIRARTLAMVERMHADAVLISDYDKGFLDGATMRKITGIAHRRDIPVVADCKRAPGAYSGAILKCNALYRHRYEAALAGKVQVDTRGNLAPLVFAGVNDPVSCPEHVLPPVVCVNHVGAGDCFASHLVLALAHGMPLYDAAAVAHHAGRVYVQHPFSLPPWPHEIVKDAEPVAGKILHRDVHAADLKSSLEGKRLVFANGVFRIPHAGHADMLAQAREHGEVLVVGVNDDVSSYRQRPGQYVMPLEQRMHMLASLACVDWVIPFAEDTPEALLDRLGSVDVLAKGEEYRNTTPPGSHLAKEVVFVPERVRVHASGLVAAIREG